MTAYGVLSRGLLTGAKTGGHGDIRAHTPRFSAGNAAQNEPLVAALARIAADKGVSPVQLAIAWVRAKGVAHGVTMIPTLGARTRTQLREVLSSLAVVLDASEVAALEAAVPASQVAGARYGEAAMAALDSER